MRKQPSPQKPEEIERYLMGFDFFERYVHGQAEGDQYVKTHSRRFSETLGMLPSLAASARILELGAIPYFFTILLTRILGIRIDVASFYEFERKTQTIHTVANRDYQETYAFEYQPMNIEKDVFPYDDQTFDLVLCCELLEHLLLNPTHMLYETHRVLKPGGHLLLTTPNVLRWQNVFALLKGRNIYDTYHGNGIYGRHNREYAPAEVESLLLGNGFEIEQLNVRNVYGSKMLNRFPVFANRRDNIFVMARAVDEPRMSYPDTLYALVEEYENVVRSAITMGRNEAGHLGRGWHGFEAAQPGFRWTTKEAAFSLKGMDNCERITIHVRSDHPKVSCGLVTIALNVDGQELGAHRLDDDSWHDLSFEIPRSEHNSVLRCRLKVSETWVPKEESSSSDSRELGVAVSKIWLE